MPATIYTLRKEPITVENDLVAVVHEMNLQAVQGKQFALLRRDIDGRPVALKISNIQHMEEDD